MGEQLTSGRDGWQLVDYEWDLETGVANLTYERESKGFTEERLVRRVQRSWWTPALVPVSANQLN